MRTFSEGRTRAVWLVMALFISGIIIALASLQTEQIYADTRAQTEETEDLPFHFYLPFAQSGVAATAAEPAEGDETEEAALANEQVETTATLTSWLPEVSVPLHFDQSLPLHQLAVITQVGQLSAALERPLLIPQSAPVVASQFFTDPVLQAPITESVPISDVLAFAGLGEDDYGIVGPLSIPADPNLAVGETQVVQWVNLSFAVFTKTTGALVLGPLPGNVIWKGFGGLCESNNNGDPIAQYDKQAKRWVLTQFAFQIATHTYLQCIAVSTSSDATGVYNRYAYQYPYFNDYTKLGIWRDGYYLSFNMFDFSGPQTIFRGGRLCTLERNRLLEGKSAQQICFQLTPNFSGELPADLDGQRAPAKGAPHLFVEFGPDFASLDLWRFKANFNQPLSSTLEGPINLPVAQFVAACNQGNCVPQALTKQRLTAYSHQVMYRFAYRRFADHESWVVNHAVNPGDGTSALRWYEIRQTNDTLQLYQQGTYAPDADFRWMGSAAMDKQGNLAIGYSTSGRQLNPALRYSGRLATDPLGTLRAERSILEGGGSQTQIFTNNGNIGHRWADYSSLSVDPVDDCTFWYTNQYQKLYGARNWSTQIAAFRFVNCN